ncbi:MAG: hypothetical protein N2515_04820, partial [Deltaproteobacteria bacterium]|nr:hypothetical protein [Deltaproteobacteria bacterium]
IPAIQAARQIYLATGNLQAVATLLEMEARVEPEEQRKVALFRELALLQRSSLGQIDGAILSLKRAVGLKSAGPEVLVELAEAYIERARQKQDPHIVQSDLERATELLLRAAQRLPLANALPLLERILDIVPTHEEAMALLVQIAEELNRPDVLPKRWAAYLARSPQGSAERRKKLAAFLIQENQIDAAIDCLTPIASHDGEACRLLLDLLLQKGNDELAAKLLEKAPLDPKSKAERLKALFDRALAQGETKKATELAWLIIELDPALPEVLRFLEAQLRKETLSKELHRVLLLRLQHEKEKSVQVQLCKEAAQLAEALGELGQAIEALRKCVALEGQKSKAREELIRLLQKDKRWQELADLLEEELSTAQDLEEKKSLVEELVKLYRGPARDLEKAASVLRLGIELEPQNSEFWRALFELLREFEPQSELIDWLKIQAQKQKTIQRELGTLFEEIAKRSSVSTSREKWLKEACAAWASLLEENPNDGDAFQRLVEIDRALGNFEHLVRIFAYRASHAEGKERAQLLYEMGQVLVREIGDFESALEAYKQAFEADPTSAELAQALSDLLERLGHYSELLAFLEKQVEQPVSSEFRLNAQRKLARLLAQEFGDEERARQLYLQILEANPEDIEALEYLEEQAEFQADFSTGEALLKRLIEVSPHPEEKHRWILRRASLWIHGMDNPQEGSAILWEALQSGPPIPSKWLAEWVETAEATRDARLLVRVLHVAIDSSSNTSRLLTWLRRLAELYEKELNDPKGAAWALLRWQALQPAEEVLRRLVPLLEASGMHEELIQVLDELAQCLENPDESKEFLRRAGELAWQMGDLEGARLRFEQGLMRRDGLAEERYFELSRAIGKADGLIASLLK